MQARPGLRGRLRPALVAAVAGLAALLLLTVLFTAFSRAQSQTGRPPGSPRRDAGAADALLRAGADDGYIDAVACAGCHAEIWESYRKTGMGRSFARMAPQGVLADFAQSNTYYHEASERHYTAFQRDGKFYQRRHQIGATGGEINVFEKEIHYFVGSGNHGRSYLHRTPDGRLLQLPLTWYSANGGYWGMSPGYNQPNHSGFRRAVDFECMACHNAYPAIEPGADVPGRTPVYPGRMPEGIDCQRCHGPGRDHLRALQQGQAAEAVRRSIVNPGRLTPERELEVCMQCHLETTSRSLPHSIVRHGRGFFSYRPGEPLADFVLHFDHAPGSGYDDKFEVVQSVYRLRQSECFRQSEGRMTCTTCHDPHHARSGRDAAAHSSKACIGCHEEAVTAMTQAGRHPRATECVSCHMPRRRTDDAVHSVMVDHLIQRRPPDRDLLAPLKEKLQNEENAYRGEVVGYYPEDLATHPEGELYLAVAQVKDSADLARGIPRLGQAIERHKPKNAGFYFELGEAYLKVGRLTDAILAFQAALERNIDLLPARKSLGLTLLMDNQFWRAADVTQQALAQAPNDAEIHNALGEIRYREKKFEAAAQHFRDAIRLDPDYPEAHNNFGATQLLLGNKPAATASFQRAVGIRPDYQAAQTNLAQVRAGPERPQPGAATDAIPDLAARAQAAEQADNLDEAARLYEQILAIRPDWAAAKLNLGIAYHSLALYPKALTILDEVVREDPSLASAFLFRGACYYYLDRYAEAVGSLEKYLSLEPGSDEARPVLAASYYGLKDYPNAALQYLQQIKLTPDNAELYFQLGETYASLAGGVVKGLEDQAKAATEGASGEPEYYWMLARVQQAIEQGDFAAAEAALEEAISLDPGQPEGLIARGYLSLARDNPGEANKTFATILQTSPDLCRALQGLADAELAGGDREGSAQTAGRFERVWPACLTYNLPGRRRGGGFDSSLATASGTTCRQAMAVRTFPPGVSARVEKALVMASCLETTGDLPAATATLLTVEDQTPRTRYLSFQILLRLAQQAYSSLARLDPDSPFVARLRAQQLEQQGKLAEADAEHQRAVQRSGSAADALVAHAQFKARIGKSQEAAPILSQAVERSPYHPRANAMLGEVYLSTSRPRDALPLLRRAIEINAADEHTRRNLATALERTGSLDEAIKVLEEAPSDSDGQIHFLLGNYYRRQGKKEKAIEALRIYQQRKSGIR